LGDTLLVRSCYFFFFSAGFAAGAVGAGAALGASFFGISKYL
jgi:hypothetical protein